MSTLVRGMAWTARALVLVLVLLASSAPRGAAASTATADGYDLAVEITPRSVTVGDHITAVLTLRTPADRSAEPRFPTWGDQWGDADVLDAGPVESGTGRPQDGSGQRTWHQRLVLAVFRPDTVTLPPVTVRVPPAAGSPGRTVEVTSGAPIQVQVESVLPPNADPATLQPTSAAPPRSLPAGARFWWTLAVGGLLAGALFLVGSLRRRRRAEGTAAAPVLPPFDELVAQLDTLRDAPPRSLEAGHVTLSLALRRYLGRRLDFPATESTTTEVRRRLRERRLPDRVIEPTALVLERCDGVKFARAHVTADALGANVAAARELARTLEEHLAMVRAPVTLTPVDSGVEAA